MPTISVTGLTIQRGHRQVLRDFNLDLAAGELTGLLGPSGSGKSTLMRALAGVQRIHGGSVTIFGQPAGSRAARGMIGYVTQAPSVYDDLSVADNLRFFAAVLGTGTDAVERVIDQVDLGTYRSVGVDRLSGGQRSRVSLGVALLGKPRLLVLDEPTVGLDPILRRDLWQLFRNLADDGIVILVSSHVMDEALNCDRVLLMREGKLLADSTPPELLVSTDAATPEDAFIALVNASSQA